MRRLFQLETLAGEPIQLDNARLIPFSQALHVRLPGIWGGVLWERPVSILVIKNDGEEEIIPIQDVSRYAIIAILGTTFFAWLVIRKLLHKTKEQEQ
jgi:uncharacterized spore protein YtfJ